MEYNVPKSEHCGTGQDNCGVPLEEIPVTVNKKCPECDILRNNGKKRVEDKQAQP
ncbi:hypothetical protein PbJCM13498_28690 [Prolixibacter bellariivorans]|uniref:Uncharacterized protein n=1 Tax=Prolixibacter bellariivorans TaxID=314319 RepID=A0A5M4B289_9BACT|nr:hypothetical protein PbJCM13498_28690 [Prolixibacter bellariivorans]